MSRAKVLDAVIAVRVSKDKSGRFRSPEEQEAEGRLDCERNGWRVVGVVNEGEISGAKSREEREDHDRLRKMIANREFDVLVAYTSSRTNRNVDEGMATLKELEGSGILYYYDGRLMDPDNPKDLVRMQHDVVDDAGYVLVVKRMVKRALDKNAADGKAHGRVPFGYAPGKRSGTLIVDDTTAPLVREAAERTLRGESGHAVCRWLDTMHPLPQRYAANPGAKWRREHGNDTPRPWGKPGWDLSRLKYMLCNPAYAGIRVHNNAAKGTTTEHEAEWTPLWDYATHRALVAHYDEPWRKKHRNSFTRAQHLLSGIAVCGECGQALYAGTSSRGRLVYRCRDGHVGVGADDLERFVAVSIVEGLAKGYGAIAKAPSEAEAKLNDKVARLQHLIDETTATLDADEDEDGEPLSAATIGRLEARVAKYATELAEVESQRPRRRTRSTATEALRTADNPEAHWDKLAAAGRYDELGTVIRDLVTITVHRLAPGATRAWSAERCTITWIDDTAEAVA